MIDPSSFLTTGFMAAPGIDPRALQSISADLLTKVNAAVAAIGAATASAGAAQAASDKAAIDRTARDAAVAALKESADAFEAFASAGFLAMPPNPTSAAGAGAGTGGDNSTNSPASGSPASAPGGADASPAGN